MLCQIDRAFMVGHVFNVTNFVNIICHATSVTYACNSEVQLGQRVALIEIVE